MARTGGMSKQGGSNHDLQTTCSLGLFVLPIKFVLWVNTVVMCCAHIQGRNALQPSEMLVAPGLRSSVAQSLSSKPAAGMLACSSVQTAPMQPTGAVGGSIGSDLLVWRLLTGEGVRLVGDSGFSGEERSTDVPLEGGISGSTGSEIAPGNAGSSKVFSLQNPAGIAPVVGGALGMVRFSGTPLWTSQSVSKPDHHCMPPLLASGYSDVTIRLQ